MSTPQQSEPVADAALPVGADRDLDRMLRHWRGRAPDREALREGDRAWSWAQLDERVDRLVAALRAAGLSAGDRFATLDRNTVALIEATLAAARSGIAHVGVNWRLADDELAYVLGDAEARLVLVGAELAPSLEAIRDRLPALDRVVVLGGERDGYEPWLAAHAPDPVAKPYAADPDDCVLQLYTSGTTGRPKGAMLSHRGLGTNSQAMSREMGLTQESTHLIVMPLFHIGGQSMALANVFAGSRTVLARDAEPGTALDLIETERVTHVFLVPTAFAYLVDHPSAPKRDLTSLRCLLYSGAPMPQPLLERSLATFPQALAIFGGYGMTEVSGMTSSLPPAEHRNPDHPERLSSVGRPLDTVEVRIVDPHDGQPVRPGEPGELLVRSPQTMVGYWRKPRETAAALVDGWLRTGDLVRQDEHGYLYITGRVKDMIVTGGENVYPAEVERVLLRHPAVADGCVIAVPDATYGEAVKAIVVPAAGQQVDEADLIAHCRASLARFKCPRSVDVRAELPRTTTGKVLKHVLREPYWAGDSDKRRAAR